VDQKGGTIVVDEEDSSLDEMTIEVPDGAYDEDARFTVTTKDFYYDDSMGIRLASTIQKEYDRNSVMNGFSMEYTNRQ